MAACQKAEKKEVSSHTAMGLKSIKKANIITISILAVFGGVVVLCLFPNAISETSKSGTQDHDNTVENRIALTVDSTSLQNTNRSPEPGQGIDKSHITQYTVVDYSSIDPDAPTADHFIKELQKLTEGFEGDGLVEAQVEFIRNAFETLRFMEAAKFLEFVYDYCGERVQGSVHLHGLSAVGRVISWPDRIAVVEWAVDLEIPSLKLDALRQAGAQLFYDEQIEQFLPRLTPEEARAFLSRYSQRSAGQVGARAIESYIRMLPDGADLSGLGQIVNALREESDILATDQLIPDDSRHIAREVRGELLRRWTRDDPQAAAAHVIANQDRIALGQLDVIVGEWAMRERREAEEWIRSQADEAVRSQAAHGMASHLVQRQAPDRAWEWALEIVDPDMRARTLREVHAAWITQDYDAAENARLSLDE